MNIQNDKKEHYKEVLDSIFMSLDYKINWFGENEDELTYFIYLKSDIFLNKKLTIPTFIIADLKDDNIFILCGNIYKISEKVNKNNIEDIVTDINKIAVGSLFIDEAENSIIYGSKLGLGNLSKDNIQQEFNYFIDTLTLLFSKLDEVKSE